MADKIEITMLGSGSSVPTAKRNHPGILLDYKAEHMLFDCGEGIQRQFRKAKKNPCKLTRLFISHWHGDHVLGIPGLLQTLYLNDYGKTLEIYGPRGTKKYMSRILEIFAYKRRIKFNIHEVTKGKIVETDDFYVEVLPMDHGAPSVAFSFVVKDVLRIDKAKLKKLKLDKKDFSKIKKLKEGKDITLNGKKIKAKTLTYLQEGKKVSLVFDTEDNANIMKIALNSDIFFCESTYFDEVELAKDHKHMTLMQAVNNAKKAKVEKLVLFHLSQRYEIREKEFLKAAKKKFKNSVVGNDLDRFEV
jgi:ribonuclease Z